MVKGIKVLDRMKSVKLLEPTRDGKPVPEQRVVIARCGQLDDDGTEVLHASAPPFGKPSVPHAAAAVASTPSLFGRPSSLGGQPAGSIFGAGAASSAATVAAAATAAPAAAAAAAVTAPGVPSALSWGQPASQKASALTPSSFGGGSGGVGGGFGGFSGFGSGVGSAGGMFGSSQMTQVPSFSQPGPGAAAPSGGGSSGGATATSNNGATGAGGGGGSGQAPSLFGGGAPERTVPPSARAAQAAAVRAGNSLGTSGLLPGVPREAGGAGGGGGSTAGAAFDRLDDAGTGWIGPDEFGALVDAAGLPDGAVEHGRALLGLCAPRLERARFLEWYASAKKAQGETVAAAAAAASGEDRRRAGLSPPARSAVVPVPVLGSAPAPGRLAGAAVAVAPASKAHRGDAGGRESGAAVSAGDGSGGVESDDDDDDDEEERREEREKAEAAFGKVDGDGKGWVEESQFEALMEAVGTTYAVEDHRPKLLAICREQRLQRQAFLMWYEEWLFGGDESSEDEAEETREDQSEKKAAGQATKGFASLLKSQAGGWKCDACLVSNPESTVKCLSCETVKPGEEANVAAAASASAASGGSVLGGGGSVGGFMFGSPPTAAAAAAKPSAVAVGAFSTNSAGGFTFGSPVGPAEPSADNKTTVPVVPTAGRNESGGFTFGSAVPPATGSVPVSRSGEAGATAASGRGNSRGSDEAKAKGEAGTASSADDESDDDDDDDEEERREEREKAEAAFDKVDSEARGWVEESQFEALMEAVGTTYAVEDHRLKLLAICREDRLQKETFMAWYEEWLFGGDESSGDEEEEGAREENQRDKKTAGQATQGFASLLKSQAGGWKCDACLVSNPESTMKCLSCETVKPGEEANVAAAASTIATSGGSVLGGAGSTGGFMFGSPPAAVAAVPDGAFSRNSAGGFTFGSPVGAAAPAANSEATAPVASFAPAAGRNESGGFTFGSEPPSTTASAPASRSAEADAGKEEAGTADSAGGASEDDDDDDDEEERREEREKAEAAFGKVDGDGKGWVEEGQFEALMEAVGTTYAVEDHKPKLLAICRENRLQKETFLAWYEEWLFGGDESSEDEAEGAREENQSGKKAAGQATMGFASLLKSQAGGWKCDACLVSNPESTVKCLSCETVKPGEEANVAAAASAAAVGGSVLGGGGSAGGFMFRSPPAAAAAAKPSAVGVGAFSTNSAGGFTFGSPVSSAAPATGSETEASAASFVPTAGRNASGGFSFGSDVPTATTAPAPVPRSAEADAS
ncbi:unnamed protein product [Laminaria digitata]